MGRIVPRRWRRAQLRSRGLGPKTKKTPAQGQGQLSGPSWLVPVGPAQGDLKTFDERDKMNLGAYYW